MKKLLFAILIISNISFAQQPFYGVTAGNGNGLKLWNDDNFKIHMGNSSEYKFGPVSDYSIKMNMSSETARGWVWGVAGLTPIAAINTSGNMQIAGSFSTTNDSNVGLDGSSTSGYGSRLNLLGASSNSDPLWMARFNNGSNVSDLRINIGDDNIGDDSFTIGNTFYADGQWKTFFKVLNNGSVGIGTTSPGSYKLAVAGKIAAAGEVRVFDATTTVFPDYVFDPSYKLPALEETEKYVKENHHLPEVPTAQEIAKDGMSLNEMNVILLKKIEELTLYMIEMKKEIKELKDSQKKQ